MNREELLDRLRLAFEVLRTGQPPAEPTAPDGAGSQRPAPPFPTTPFPGSADGDELGRVPESTVRLIALRDYLRQGGDEDERIGKALAAVDRKLADILALDDVVAFEDDGRFEPERHHAVESIETTDAEQHYQLGSTVRPGYLRGGRLYRRQDVVVLRLPGDRSRVGS